VVFLSGLARITLPVTNASVTAAGSVGDSVDEAWILGGANGVIIAVDTMGSGHITTYPSDEKTISFQIPFADGVVPAHRVLHAGPCHYTGDNGQGLGSLLAGAA